MIPFLFVLGGKLSRFITFWIMLGPKMEKSERKQVDRTLGHFGSQNEWFDIILDHFGSQEVARRLPGSSQECPRRPQENPGGTHELSEKP